MKSHTEYLYESDELSRADKPKEALRAHLNALFAFEEETDQPIDYRFYLALGDRYSATGHFEYLDRVYEKAYELAGEDELAQARVLTESALSSVAAERRLDRVKDSLDTAEARLVLMEESDEVIGLKSKIDDIRSVHATIIGRLSDTEVYGYKIAS